MVTETHHNALLQETAGWQHQLQEACEKIQQMQLQLYHFAAGRTAKELLMEIEHYHNQFHIQLINLHDLKHELRHHLEEADRQAHFSLRAPHHQLKEKCDDLEKRIADLGNDFAHFIRSNP